MKKKTVFPPAVPLDLDGMVIDNLKKDEGFRQAYLKDLLTEKDIPILAASLKPVIDALGGVSKLSKETGLGRESLYKALSGKRIPEFSTLLKILDFAGYELALRKKTTPKKRSGHLARIS